MNLRILLFTVALALCAAPAAAQTTAFTYQGRLTDNNFAANGNYDIRFSLHSVASGAGSVGTPQTVNPVVVAGGLFTATLDFGANFPGADRWLQVEVRPSGSAAAYTVLTPRQRITAAPYASRAATAAALSGNITTGQISGGTLASALFADNSIAATRLMNDSIGAAQIATGAVTSSELGTGAVTAVKMDPAIGLWNKSGTTISYPGGAVGIGTTAPAGALLDLEGALRLNNHDLYLREGTDANHGLGWYGAAKPWASVAVDGPVLYGWGGGALGTTASAQRTALSWDNSGKVRVGTNVLNGWLEVTTSGDKSLRVLNDDFVPGLTTVSTSSTDPYAGYLRIRHAVELWPKSDGSAAARLDVRDAAGNPTIVLDGGSGESTVKTLNITGGADVAEPIRMDEDVPPGAAVVIDADRPGAVKLSAAAYDTCVAGIVSGANGVKPGLSLRQEGVLEGGKNVALTGRVYALADAESSPIKPGDLLVTSDIPGHVMKAVDRERSHGAILGKAMTPLKSGRGMVLVLVNLQ